MIDVRSGERHYWGVPWPPRPAWTLGWSIT